MSDGLAFEHVGTMRCGERLLICDVHYFPGRFAGMARRSVGLDASVEIEPGTWQVLVARGVDDEIELVVFTHDRELDQDVPLESAEVVARIQVDSGRIVAIDPELRDDDDIQTAVLEAPREQVPCMLRALDAGDEEPPRGALLDIDAAGTFELHASLGSPRTALFLVL